MEDEINRLRHELVRKDEEINRLLSSNSNTDKAVKRAEDAVAQIKASSGLIC